MIVRFLGLRLDSLTMEETLSKSIELISIRNKQHVVLNASKVVMASAQPDLANVINQCDLVNADGMSVVWAARMLGLSIPERVAGVDYMFRLMELAAQRGYKVYLLGATKEVVQKTACYFQQMGVDVVGLRDGFWDKEKELELVSEIATSVPDIILIAIPSPQKEIFLHKHLANLNCGLAVGVGGSFDIVAGQTKRAPIWMQNIGMEWLFRLVQEPKRMFLRYLIGNAKFTALVLRELMLKRVRGERN